MSVVVLFLSLLRPIEGSVSNASTPCTTDLDCSLNGVCASATGACECDQPWAGPRCGRLEFAAKSPAAGRDLYPEGDTRINTWNGPMLGPVNGTYHMYLPLYENPSSTPLYNPTSMAHGTATSRLGPWTWRNMSGVEVNINPGALAYGEGENRRYTLWTSGHNGTIYESESPAGPFTEVPGGNTSGCYINPSPLFDNDAFFCTGQKGTTIMTATSLGGPWSEYAQLDAGEGEDPFLWVDKRGNWHALKHAADGSQVDNCAAAKVSSHAFSADQGKTWSALAGPEVEPYKPLVMWDDSPTPQAYSSMERPHAYFDPVSGQMTQLTVAAPLDMGDKGCANGKIGRQGCKAKKPPCPCCNCKYLSHSGTVMVSLAGSIFKG